MDTAEQIIASLNQILVRDFEVDATSLTAETRLREDLDLDSLDAADLLIAIEKKWTIRIDETVARKFRTLGDVHAHVRELVDKSQGSPPG